MAGRRVGCPPGEQSAEFQKSVKTKKTLAGMAPKAGENELYAREGENQPHQTNENLTINLGGGRPRKPVKTKKHVLAQQKPCSQNEEKPWRGIFSRSARSLTEEGGFRVFLAMSDE